MLNYLWSFMLIFSILISAFKGDIRPLTQSILASSQDAVKICFETLGVLAMWMGVMRIAEKSKLIDALTRHMTPILNFLFPDIPLHHPARKYIATNLIANFLGLGWAATPPGLKAMSQLQKLNSSSDTASHAMCMFLIINMSSVQLLSINIISYRASVGSTNPTEIVGPSIIATACSTLIALIFAKCMYRKEP